MRASALFILLLINITGTAYGEMPERVVWDKKPVRVQLSVGQERIVHFPADIRYWLPDRLQTSLTVLAANGVLYLQAHEAFDITRIRVQEIESQQVYLLDLTGQQHGDETQSYNQYQTNELIIMSPESVVNQSKQSLPKKAQNDWYVRLTRFAAQQLYVPERLLIPDSSIRRVRINRKDEVSLVRGADIEAIPVGAWQGGGLFVTAVRLRNLSMREKVFDPRVDIRGSWLAATLQHGSIGTAGSDEDRTCIYLISVRPFEESL